MPSAVRYLGTIKVSYDPRSSAQRLNSQRKAIHYVEDHKNQHDGLKCEGWWSVSSWVSFEQL